MIERQSELWRARFRFTSAERFNRFVLRMPARRSPRVHPMTLKQNWPMLSAAPPHWLSSIVLPAIGRLLSLAAYIVAPTATLLRHRDRVGHRVPRLACFAAVRRFHRIAASASQRRPAQRRFAGLHHHRGALPRSRVGRRITVGHRAARLSTGKARRDPRGRSRRSRDARGHRRPQNAAFRSPSFRFRRSARAPNRKRSMSRCRLRAEPSPSSTMPRTGPNPINLRGALQAFRAGGRRPRLRAGAALHRQYRRQLARAVISPPNTPASSTSFCPACRAWAFRCRSAARPIISTPRPLREIGAWDPYNVTEDADLGMRLARFGYRADMIDSTTYEEAPARIGALAASAHTLVQGLDADLAGAYAPAAPAFARTRAARLSRLPAHRRRQRAGGAGASPVRGGLIYSVANGAPLWRGDNAAVVALARSTAPPPSIGYLTSAFLGWLGLMRRGLLPTAWVLMLTPVHWLLLSLAAWRAVYQSSSRPMPGKRPSTAWPRLRAAPPRLTRALLELERHLSELKSGGQLPTLAESPPTYTSAERRRPPRRAAA